MPYANNQQAIYNYNRFQSNITGQVIHPCSIDTNGVSIISSPQVLQAPQVQYQSQPPPYQPLGSVHISQQQPSPQTLYQQTLYQPLHYQMQSQVYRQQQGTRIQLQHIIGQQQMRPSQQQPQVYYQEQPQQSPSLIVHYFPNSANPPSSITQQKQTHLLQFPEENGTDEVPQGVLNQIEYCRLSHETLKQSTTNSIQQQTSPDEVEDRNSL